MKQIIKIIPVLFLIVGLSTEVRAQQSDNSDISATANVVTAIEVTGDEDLIFGNVTPGNAKTIDADGGVVQGIASGGEQAGQFTVLKGLNTGVTLEFELPAVLESGVETLAIDFEDYSGTEVAKLSFAALPDLHFDPTVSLIIGSDVDTEDYFGSDEFSVSIGGTVVPAANQAAGLYEGDIVLTATYN